MEFQDLEQGPSSSYCRAALEDPKATETRQKTADYKDFLDGLRSKDRIRQRMRPSLTKRRDLTRIRRYV